MITQARRRTEEHRPLAAQRFERALRGVDFPRERAWKRHRKRVNVNLRVVFERMAARNDFARQLRVALRFRANAEECRAHAEGVEQVEHLRRDDRVGTVVDGQRDGVGVARRGGQPGPVRAQQRSAGQQARYGENSVIRDDRGQPPGPCGGYEQPSGEHADMPRGSGAEHRGVGGEWPAARVVARGAMRRRREFFHQACFLASFLRPGKAFNGASRVLYFIVGSGTRLAAANDTIDARAVPMWTETCMHARRRLARRDARVRRTFWKQGDCFDIDGNQEGRAGHRARAVGSAARVR